MKNNTHFPGHFQIKREKKDKVNIFNWAVCRVYRVVTETTNEHEAQLWCYDNKHSKLY